MNTLDSPTKAPAPEEQEMIKNESAWISLLKQEIGQVIIGQKYLVDRLIMGLLANGHVLLEGVPGLAKTLAVKTLADCIKGEFTTEKGPIFTNLLLADEINRAPAKVQSALLEGMQERQVTIGDQTYPLPQPFLVLATENPIDQEGTYPLPEAQMDRFMLKLMVDYPDREEELKILNANANSAEKKEVNPVVDAETIFRSRKLIDHIYLDDKLKGYLVDLILATRNPNEHGASELESFIRFGASPRATISLAMASKAVAFMQGRSFVTPQDIKDVAPDVLRHRVIVTYEAEAENIASDQVIQKILDTVPVP